MLTVYKLAFLVPLTAVSLVSVLIPVADQLSPFGLFVCRHFGTGVIIATALVHLLEPAAEALDNEVLSDTWRAFPVAYGVCLFSLFSVFSLDMVMRRRLAQLGQAHCHSSSLAVIKAGAEVDVDDDENDNSDDEGYAGDVASPNEVVGLIIMEAGIVVHSLFIGITLALAEQEAVSLSLAVLAHQTFEGLGLGARLARIPRTDGSAWLPRALAFIFALVTPLGVLVGLAVRMRYTPDSPAHFIGTGLSDAASAGILLYTGLVELMGGEMVFAQDLACAPFSDVAVATGAMIGGGFVMSLMALWV